MRLEATPRGRPAELALRIYERVLDDVRGDRLVERSVRRQGSEVEVAGTAPDGQRLTERVDLAQFGRVFLCGVGKASVGMARALEGVLADRLTAGLVVTRRGDSGRLDRVSVAEAAHPVPDQSSLDAGRKMFALLAGLEESDLVFFCLSGGASSLMEMPVEGVTLGDLQRVNEFMLANGLDIGRMNAIRRCLSRIKGGGLATACKATVICLVLSDVIGNDLSVIGSGPFYPPKIGNVFELARSSGVLGVLPEGAGKLFRGSATPVPPGGRVRHFIVGSVLTALQSAQAAATELGLAATVEPTALVGDARLAAQTVLSPSLPRGSCRIFGGETTVQIRGDGKGGRCQELACQAAHLIEGQTDLAVLAAGTDGSDGPTDAAGAVVDGDAADRGRAGGMTAISALAASDSYAFHRAAGTLIRTGPTQSNVDDIVLAVRAAPG